MTKQVTSDPFLFSNPLTQDWPPRTRLNRMMWHRYGADTREVLTEEADTESTALSQELDPDSCWSRCFEKLAGLRELKDDWDSYSAPCPSPLAIENAKALVGEANKLSTRPEQVEPSAIGGVGVTFSANCREVVIEFYNKGTAHALFSDDSTGEMSTRAVSTDPDGYQTFIGEVRKYLYGE
jgi:hypothetical protein